MGTRDNERDRFGSARFATAAEMEAAGLFDKGPNSIFVGFFEGRAVYHSGPGGMIVTAGARAGKLRDWLAHNIITGTCLQSLVMLDPKGEGAYISQDQTADGKFCAYWNPLGLHGLEEDRLNPVDFLRIDSRSIVSDMKITCESLIPMSGSAQGQYFEGRAREWLEAIGLTCIELRGALTLPDLYDAVNYIPARGADWQVFSNAMVCSRFPIARRAEGEISAGLKSPDGGFQGILGEILKSLSCLSDPVLMDSVSPPYTFSMSELVSGDQTWQVYLMPPAEMLSPWAPVIKTIFTAAMIYKSRAPSAPRISFFMDECGQLAGGPSGGFELVPRLFSYGAGIGCQPIAVFQTSAQMRNLGPEAERIITSSAACRLQFALRDYPSARDASAMLGKQTLSFDDQLQQSRARLSFTRGLQRLLSGEDPFALGLELAQARRESRHRTKQERALMTADEIMNMGGNEALLHVDGLSSPALLTREPYWMRPELAGRYQPNPYHPPLDRVRVMTSRGEETRRVIRAPVSGEFAHYRQYRSGIRQYVET